MISLVLIPVSTVEVVAADVQRHHDLLERRVARPLADPVHGALDLRRAGLDPGERVRDREAEVVVAVHGERHVADLRAAAANVGDEPGVLRGQRVADRVGQVDDRRARLDRDAADLRGERRVGAGRVLARELDLVDERGRVADRASARAP